MPTDLRVVVDTSVVGSALLLPRSVPRQSFDLAAKLGRLLISEATIGELDAVLQRPKFGRYFTERQRLEFLTAFIHQADLVEVTEVIAVCRDSKDDKFLELAVSGNASHMISGDTDLLELHPFRGIQIVTPLSFLERFGDS